MSARLFAAIWPSEQFVAELDDFLEPRRVAEPRLRWTRPQSWHLTTAFMGRVSDDKIDRLIASLDSAAKRTAGFTLSAGGAGAFPNPLLAKALWLGFDDGAAAIAGLAVRCRKAANMAGVRVDGSEFVAHLTVARTNRPVDCTRLLHVLDSFDAAPFEVSELLLVQSNLNDPGNRYELIERFPLAG